MSLTIEIPTEREDALRPVSGILELFSLPPDWNGPDYVAPDPVSVISALYWATNFQREVMQNGAEWVPPHPTASADGEAVLEWWSAAKKLTVYFPSEGGAEYVASWAADPNAMRDGTANTREERAALWKWLYE